MELWLCVKKFQTQKYLSDKKIDEAVNILQTRLKRSFYHKKEWWCCQNVVTEPQYMYVLEGQKGQECNCQIVAKNTPLQTPL